MRLRDWRRMWAEFSVDGESLVATDRGGLGHDWEEGDYCGHLRFRGRQRTETGTGDSSIRLFDDTDGSRNREMVVERLRARRALVGQDGASTFRPGDTLHLNWVPAADPLIDDRGSMYLSFGLFFRAEGSNSDQEVLFKGAFHDGSYSTDFFIEASGTAFVIRTGPTYSNPCCLTCRWWRVHQLRFAQPNSPPRRS